MTRDEHRDILAFIDGAVRQDDPARALLDVEADAIIRALFVRNPEAAYRMTRLAMAQRDELSRLQAELAEAKAQVQVQANWFSRMLKGRNRSQRSLRRDPDLAMISSNSGSS